MKSQILTTANTLIEEEVPDPTTLKLSVHFSDRGQLSAEYVRKGEERGECVQERQTAGKWERIQREEFGMQREREGKKERAEASRVIT